jgi:hypothetical protein
MYIPINDDEAAQLKNDTKYLKHIIYNGDSSLSFEKNAQNCVDSLDVIDTRFYFVRLYMGPQYLLIVQATALNFKSYIAFGYYQSLSFQSKANGVWGSLKSLG